jgi:two-component system sensor histidine kinase/response regulator
VESVAQAPKTPLTPEVLVPRLGERLVEKGALSQDDLQRALEKHRQLAQAGQPKLIGQILLDMNLVTQDLLDRVVTEQILQLQHALQASNRELENRVEERTYDLQNALDRLSELNALKSSFISNISHELRTPLTHIKGYLLLLSDGSLGELSPEQKEALEVMVRSEERLEQLIEDLIQFSLTARGQLSINLKPVGVADLMFRTRSKVERLADGRNVRLELRIPDQQAFVRVDLEKISWVLMQLQDNAIKFTPEGGVVQVQVILDGGIAVFSVKDNGIGIPPERINEIFEPFRQLDSADNRRFGGTGLGLAMVKKIIEAHGSTIKVHSEPNIGSEFEFALPLS